MDGHQSVLGRRRPPRVVGVGSQPGAHPFEPIEPRRRGVAWGAAEVGSPRSSFIQLCVLDRRSHPSMVSRHGHSAGFLERCVLC